MTLNPSKIYSVKGGNVQVIEKLLEAAGAQVRTNSEVTDVIRNSDGTVTVKTSRSSSLAPIQVLTSSYPQHYIANGSEQFDGVMIATQLYYANKIRWEGISLPHGFTVGKI